jgi:hypothetical protein
LEYSDYSESEEESSCVEEDKSLIKRKDTEEEENDVNREEIKLHDKRIIKNK